MLIDLYETFSGSTSQDGAKIGQSITATALSTNVLDLRNASVPALQDDHTGASPLFLVVQVLQAFNSLTSLTLTIETDSSPAMATAPVVLYSKTVLLASLGANQWIVRCRLPADDYKRYLALRYTVTGTNPSQGSLHAYLTPTPQRNISYASAVALDV